MKSPANPNTTWGYGHYPYNNFDYTDMNEQMLVDKANAVAINVADGHIDVTISTNSSMNTEVILSDLQGRVYGSSRGNVVHSFDTSHLPQGSYLLYINDGENVRTERINVK